MDCLYCGKPVEQASRGRKRKYCSDYCRNEADKEHKRIVYVGKRKEKCDFCGKTLPKYKTRFCSDLCSKKYNDIKNGFIQDHGELTKICPVCGKEFKTWKSTKITCSDECSRKRDNRRKRTVHDRKKYLKKHPNAKSMEEIRLKKKADEEVKTAKREERKKALDAIREEKETKKRANIAKYLEYEAVHECSVCGGKFTAHYPTAKYCSKKCQRKIYKDNKHRYDGIKVDKDISLPKLMRRDRGICQLCGEPVDITDYVKTNDYVVCGDRYPSIDHIRPVSLGGLHSWDNVQLAHRYCNTLKSNRYIG